MTQMKTSLQTAVIRIAVMIAAVLVMAGIRPVTAKAASDGFYVNGTTYYDANGNPFVMRGINVPHAWFPEQTKTAIDAIAKTDSNTVRIVVADGETYTKTTYNELVQIIEWCKQNQMICVLDVHDATGSDSVDSLMNAVRYWIEMKNALIGNEKYVIVNIANEWHGTWDGAKWAEGYRTAVQMLREAGIKNMLMVDCAGWGQYPDSIRDYGKSVFESDPQKNVVFSIHMYEYAGGSADTVKQNINNALGIGSPLVIGEFAHRHTDGDVDEDTIMSECRIKNIGYLGWSWYGNNDKYAYLDIATDWAGAGLTEWGNRLVNGVDGIRQTSQICTVFSDPYISLFWGEVTAQPWKQAVTIPMAKNGGSFSAAQMKPDGYFYVEYSGADPEFILQSWSDGDKWKVVRASETGTANGHSFAKYSYQNCVQAFGTDNFEHTLDQILVGAGEHAVTIYSVCYCK